MFGGLLSSRVRAAEQALRDGRLDEAHRLATSPDLRQERKLSELLKELTARFIERAEGHFFADRFAEALLDLNRAEAGGVMGARIIQLRDNIRAVSQEFLRKQKERRDRLQAVEQRIAAGTLEAGRDLLEAASVADAAAGALKKELERRAVEAKEQYAVAERLMKNDQIGAAVTCFRRAKALHVDAPEGAELENTIMEKVLHGVREFLKEGWISRATEEMTLLKDVGQDRADRRELEMSLHVARVACEAMKAGEYSKARHELVRLNRLFPGTQWVEKTVEELRQVDELVTALGAGPLGEGMEGAAAAFAETLPLRAHQGAGPGAKDTAHRAMAHTADRLLMLVDDGGSYLVLRKGRVSLGRAAASKTPDVPIFSDLAERHADIQRIEDDYFLFSEREVEVNGRRVKQHLLRDGDRVVLGRRAKFNFRLPSRKSPSAVLELSDTSKLPNDVRRVVLFKDNALIGRSSAAHMPCHGGSGDLVLFERAGTLWARPQGGRADEALAVEVGRSAQIGGVSFVAKAV